MLKSPIDYSFDYWYDVLKKKAENRRKKEALQKIFMHTNVKKSVQE